jgi:hypothetical protein
MMAAPDLSIDFCARIRRLSRLCQKCCGGDVPQVGVIVAGEVLCNYCKRCFAHTLADSLNSRSIVHGPPASPAATAGVVLSVMCGRQKLYHAQTTQTSVCGSPTSC